LGLATLLDRLIQQALHQVMQPLFEAEFSESRYGFRPGGSAHQAVQAERVMHAVTAFLGAVLKLKVNASKSLEERGGWSVAAEVSWLQQDGSQEAEAGRA
jgi:hypothetical protein